MDSNLLALIAIVVLAVVIGLVAFRFWGRRRLKEVAADRRVTVLPEMLREFGRSVILGADSGRVIALVDGLPKRKPKPLSPGVWGINYISKRDVVIEVRPTSAGAEVLVTSLVEHSGFPQGLSTWQRFVEQLEQAAAAEGIAVDRGRHMLRYAPAPPNSLEHGSWTI